ncbi:MAG TPA: carboxylesterase [Chromatiaceae bacterium]|nr:carboxylesterase [Chromatiaceae bacterium]
MLEALIETTAPEPDAAVIWLHGLGADGYDFSPIVPQLGLPAEARIRFVFPHAPEMPVTLNGGYVMRAWYDIVEPNLSARVDMAGIQRSVGLIDELVEAQLAAGITAARIILAGFSQGGVIALHAALRANHAFGGVMALSTYLPMSPDLHAPAGLSVFQAHGELDEMVPITAAIQARNWLTQAGCEVEWHQYAMAHAVCAEEIGAIGRWLAHRLV